MFIIHSFICLLSNRVISRMMCSQSVIIAKWNPSKWYNILTSLRSGLFGDDGRLTVHRLLHMQCLWLPAKQNSFVWRNDADNNADHVWTLQRSVCTCNQNFLFHFLQTTGWMTAFFHFSCLILTLFLSLYECVFLFQHPLVCTIAFCHHGNWTSHVFPSSLSFSCSLPGGRSLSDDGHLTCPISNASCPTASRTTIKIQVT